MTDFVRLSDLCTRITDGSHYSPEGVATGYPMFSVKDMRENGFSYDDCKYINKAEYDRMKKSGCVPEVNDILIAKDGSYLKCIFVVTEAREEAVLSSIGILRPDLSKVNPYYIKYYLSSAFVKNQVARKYVSGSALPRIILKNFADIEVPYISLEEQNRIVNVLKPLDDKIENNNAVCTELEAMAKLLYDYWFVQFDFPDENGKPYKSSGGKMVWNEELKREIPEGWEVKTFGALASFKKGKIPNALTDTASDDSYYPYLTIDVANGGTPQFCRYDNMPVCNGETIMVMDGAASGDVYVGCSGVLGSTFAMISSSNDNTISDALIYRILKSKQVVYKKANTGSTVPHANRSFIESMQICLPKNVEKLAKRFDKIQETITHLKNENRELVSLRDFLLPLLMNGQVGFKEVDNH